MPCSALIIDGAARGAGVDPPAPNGVVHVINGVLTSVANGTP